jgi:multicomponent K+:H+ antiporter subunit F
MLTSAIILTFALVGAAILLCLWRLVQGPGPLDRILALDTLTINAIAVVLLIDVVYDTKAYFEAALILAMMGFVATVALAKYRLGGDIIE